MFLRLRGRPLGAKTSTLSPDTKFVSQGDKRASVLQRINGAIRALAHDFRYNRSLLIMALPGLVLLLVFSYLPMLGSVVAFQDYRPAKGLFGSEWIGFENFRYLGHRNCNLPERGAQPVGCPNVSVDPLHTLLPVMDHCKLPLIRVSANGRRGDQQHAAVTRR
jgi:hypothetical protein